MAMKLKKWLYVLGVVVVMSFGLTKCAVINTDVELPNSKKVFKNTEVEYQSSLGDVFRIAKMFMTAKRNIPEPVKPIPVKPISQQQLLAGNEDVIYRLGHSTLLLRLSGEFVLIDPVFGERVSPVSWMGPKRFHQPPINIAQLPELKAVVISHDHYDHLEVDAIKALKDKTANFVTPLNVGERLKSWGIKESKITQLDWWQSVSFDSLTFTAAPAQHFSGRGLFDKDKTLWAGWAIKSQHSDVFYTGDTGYFDGFKQIGERLGPFDLTIVETGAYNDMWLPIHMLPEQSVQAHVDLKGKAMMPVHNGTFDLSLHDWFEPLDRALVAANQHQVELLTPIFGEAVSIKAPQPTGRWWQSISLSDDDHDARQIAQIR